MFRFMFLREHIHFKNQYFYILNESLIIFKNVYFPKTFKKIF